MSKTRLGQVSLYVPNGMLRPKQSYALRELDGLRLGLSLIPMNGGDGIFGSATTQELRRFVWTGRAPKPLLELPPFGLGELVKELNRRVSKADEMVISTTKDGLLEVIIKYV